MEVTMTLLYLLDFNQNFSYDLSIAQAANDSRIRLTVFDEAGNSSTDYTPQFNVIDNTVPIITLNTPVSTGIGDTLLISWYSQDNFSMMNHSIYFSIHPDSNFIFIDHADGQAQSYEWIIPDLVSDQLRIKVIAYDDNNLSASDTSNFFSIYDLIPPVLNLISPSLEYSILEYSPITVQWLAIDNIAMDTVAVYYSNDNGLNYSYKGFATYPEDSFIFSIPFGITEDAMIKLKAVDIFGNETIKTSDRFTVTDNTPPQVFFDVNLTDSTVYIAQQLDITWISSDNLETESITLDYRTNSEWNSIVNNIQDNGVYSWVIPNEPTNNLQIRIIVFDVVGLSDTSIVDNISIDIIYPKVENSLPSTHNLFLTTSTLNFILTQSLDPSVNSETVTISSAIHTYSPLISYIDSSNSISILFEDGLATMDSITVTLSDEIKNIYGYSLDGDGDGEGGGDYVASYTTQMLADFDADGAITIGGSISICYWS